MTQAVLVRFYTDWDGFDKTGKPDFQWGSRSTLSTGDPLVPYPQDEIVSEGELFRVHRRKFLDGDTVSILLERVSR